MLIILLIIGLILAVTGIVIAVKQSHPTIIIALIPYTAGLMMFLCQIALLWSTADAGEAVFNQKGLIAGMIILGISLFWMSRTPKKSASWLIGLILYSAGSIAFMFSGIMWILLELASRS